MHPESNIVAVDYDPGASEVNQLNRIKLMISVAKENYKNGVNGEFKLENADDPVTNDATMPYTGRDKFGLDSVVREGGHSCSSHHVSALEATGANLGDHGRTAPDHGKDYGSIRLSEEQMAAIERAKKKAGVK